MSTEVIWHPRAFDRMSFIVRRFPERKAAFAAALRGLSLALTPYPERTGESREPPFRVLVCDPLTFRFRPLPDEDAVQIVWVHLREGSDSPP